MPTVPIRKFVIPPAIPTIILGSTPSKKWLTLEGRLSKGFLSIRDSGLSTSDPEVLQIQNRLFFVVLNLVELTGFFQMSASVTEQYLILPVRISFSGHSFNSQRKIISECDNGYRCQLR